MSWRIIWRANWRRSEWKYMVKEYYEEISKGNQIRQNLIALRQELRQEGNQRALAYLLGGDFRLFTNLLRAEDPKIRKNAALILGDMETEDVLPFLFAAYNKEETLFVRTDYLKAMAKMDYSDYFSKLKGRLETLRGMEQTEENRKHIREEMQQLQAMVLRYEKPKRHHFIGYEPGPEVILVTNRNQKEVTIQQIGTGQVTELGQGIRIKDGNLKELQQIRTYTELLFPIPGARVLEGSPAQIGEALLKLSLVEFLDDLHKEGGIYYYRIEVKGPMPLDKKGSFIRRISEVLETGSEGRLMNTATDYEAELRLLERKDGSFVPMLKLYTLPDHRFDYRKEVAASSIAPVNAALTVELARKYLKEDAQILDPFCGVGTMLLERNKAVSADPMYGIDIYGEAVDKARINTERDGSIVHYINRDFFDFTHEYLFDEIITDMPQVSKGKGREEIGLLYRRFFEKAPEFLKERAVLILYSTEPEFVQEELRRSHRYKKLDEFIMNEKKQTKVFVLELC
ncbi:MAG: methyltransferase domain-containing protein [Lachnospiraceae bacterium]|nr:methyltransferase domain-containing protein [Lachnospiraceae bacterium]